MTRYPRDMTGYGATPPNANWPNGAKIAVQIVLNYEEGGENNILHGDPASEAFLSEITGADLNYLTSYDSQSGPITDFVPKFVFSLAPKGKLWTSHFSMHLSDVCRDRY